MRRDPAAIAAAKPWDEGGEYPNNKRYEAVIMSAGAGFAAAFALLFVGRCLAASCKFTLPPFTFIGIVSYRPSPI